MYRVGVLGAGPGASALHLPTLAGLGDLFEVVHIADAGSGRARALAERTGARWSTGTDGVFADPEVDVVAVCTPHSAHADEILAAVAAGKRAIFCEKPVGTTRGEVEAVVAACVAADVALTVGTNHLFDPGWSRAKHGLGATAGEVRSIVVSLALSPNSRYHDVVSQAPTGPSRSRAVADVSDPRVSAAMVRELVIGLGVHDLPLVRDLAPDFEGLDIARMIPPIGFDIGFRASGIAVRHTAVMHADGPDSRWRVSIVTDHDRVDIDFPPPFVQAGGARVHVRDTAGRTTVYPTAGSNGYESEWRALAAILAGEQPMEFDELRADAFYAVDIADAAAALILEGGAA